MRCMNEGCVDWTRTRNNYCGRFADLADCDEKEPRNLPEADVKPPLCDVRELLRMIDDIPCTCDIAYKSRGLSAPDCPRCNYVDKDIVEKVRANIA